MDRLKKGDKVVVVKDMFAPRVNGLIHPGTDGLVIRGGRWNAVVDVDVSDKDGHWPTRLSVLPHVSSTLVKRGTA